MDYSKSMKFTVKTSHSHQAQVTVTAQRIKNDINGNPRYRVQVWVIKDNGEGHLWSPNVKGYRRNANDEYTVNGTHGSIQQDLTSFIEAFEKAVYHE